MGSRTSTPSPCPAVRFRSTRSPGTPSEALGGGFYNDGDGQATLTGTDITENSADEGGGFYLTSGSTLTLHSATISTNTARLGEAVAYQQGATYTPNNSTVEGTVVQV